MSDRPPLQCRFGEFQVDEGNARLSRAGRPVDLPPKAFELLCALARHPGQLVTKDALLDAVWGHRFVSESVLKTTISQLRGALADDARAPRYIETAARRGYRFIAPFEAAPLQAPAVLPALADIDAAATDAALIGRAAALRQLAASLDLAAHGKRQLVLVAGEPGIGKTTLIDRFLATLAPARATQALGQCVEHYGAAEPYMPVLEALNMRCRADAGLVELMRRTAPTWLAQLPWYLGSEDRHQLQREVAGSTQDRMLRELGELLDRYTAQQPLLLVLEDLHWSDHATVQLIGYLARRRGPAALMLLGSFRPTDIIVDEHPLAGLRQELRLHGLCKEIDLEAFSETDTAAFVADRLDGAPVPEAFVRALQAHTEGLPLFVANLLDELRAEGTLRRADDAGAWRFPDLAEVTVPSSLLGVVEKRIARLPAQLQHVLGVASVAGTEFLHLPLAEALSMPAEALQALLDDADQRHHWLRGGGSATLPDGRRAARYAFRHALYRHVFYQRLGAAQRPPWHRRIGDALRSAHGAAAGEVAAELAMHFERAHEPALAIGQLAVVAARALGRSAAREALHAARHGLRLIAERPAGQAPPDIELDLCVLEGVALTRLHAIAEPEVAAAFERARVVCERVGANPARARALHGLWWVSFARSELDAALALAQRILALADGSGDDGLRLAGNSALGMTLMNRGQFAESRHHLEAALALYEQVGDALPAGMFVQDPGVEAITYLALVCWWTGEPARARRLIDEGIALAQRIRHPISQMIALHMGAALHCFTGEFAQARDVARQRFEVIRRHGLPLGPGEHSWLHGRALVSLGEVDAGLAEIVASEQDCLALGMRIGLSGCHFHHADACGAVERVDDALAVAERGLAEAGLEGFALAPLQRLRADLLMRRGDRAGAHASLRAALSTAERQGARFHELVALASALRMPGFPTQGLRERLRALLTLYDGDPSPIVAQARAQLDA